MFPALRLRRLAAAFFMSLGAACAAAPFTPASDADVVERLPANADPAVRGVESLRRQLAARPDDALLRIDIARRYFDLAMAQGDPRYVGYAASAIAPLASTSQTSPSYWLVRGLVQQYSHDFEGALVSLARAAQADPASAEPLSWRAAIFMVQARYAEALAACQQLTPLAEPLLGAGCTAYVQATTGQLESAYGELAKVLARSPNAGPELMLWQLTRLAEMAWRLGRQEEADRHFKRALSLGVTDQFLLGAYADFLIERQRPADVLKLLAGWERSDILLLRLALAGKAANDPRAAGWASQLRERFTAANQRGDRLHEQEGARFELDIEGQPRKALELAAHNYTVQKEPRDAEVLMRAALAAGDAKAAQPALDWLRTSKYEDPKLNELAARLAEKGAQR